MDRQSTWLRSLKTGTPAVNAGLRYQCKLIANHQNWMLLQQKRHTCFPKPLPPVRHDQRSSNEERNLQSQQWTPSKMGCLTQKAYGYKLSLSIPSHPHPKELPEPWSFQETHVWGNDDCGNRRVAMMWQFTIYIHIHAAWRAIHTLAMSSASRLAFLCCALMGRSAMIHQFLIKPKNSFSLFLVQLFMAQKCVSFFHHFLLTTLA